MKPRADAHRRAPRRAGAPLAAAAVAAVLLPSLLLAPPLTPTAWALCPNCLAQQSTLTPTLKLIALFLLLPFALAAAVFWVVRRMGS